MAAFDRFLSLSVFPDMFQKILCAGPLVQAEALTYYVVMLSLEVDEYTPCLALRYGPDALSEHGYLHCRSSKPLGIEAQCWRSLSQEPPFLNGVWNTEVYCLLGPVGSLLESLTKAKAPPPATMLVTHPSTTHHLQLQISR